MPRRRGDRPRTGPPGPGRRAPSVGRHEPGAAEARIGRRSAGGGAGKGGRDLAGGGLPRPPGGPPPSRTRQLRAARRPIRSGRGRGRRQPGRDQSAPERHRQHGLRASGRCTGLPARGHRPGRRHRGARRHARRARPGRRGAGHELRDQPLPGRPRPLRRRRARDRAAHGLALPRRRAVARRGATAAGRGLGGPCRASRASGARRARPLPPRPRQGRGAAAAAHRERRRLRSLAAGAGRRPRNGLPRPPPAAGRGRGGAAGDEVDAQRPRLPPSPRLGSRHPGARTRGRPGPGPVRRLPDARPPRARRRGRRRLHRRSARPRAAGRGHRDGAGEGGASGRGHLRPDRGADFADTRSTPAGPPAPTRRRARWRIWSAARTAPWASTGG